MNWAEWVSSSGFDEVWTVAFEGVESVFDGSNAPVEKPHVYREEGALWLELREPLAGVRLITAEVPSTVTPISMSLRVWTYEQASELYEGFAMGERFSLNGAPLPRYPNQKPKASWQSQLDRKGIKVRGVRYVVTLDGLIDAGAADAGARLRDVVASFCDYVIHRASAPAPDGHQTEAQVAPQQSAAPACDSAQSPAPAIHDEQEPLSATARDILQIESDPRFGGLGLPMRAVLANARIGQGNYRQRMLALWDYKCALTGCAVQEVLIASHARAWSECEGAHDCLDEYNGLLLVANVDRLFDCGLISFDDEGRVLTKQGFDTEGLVLMPKLRFIDERHRPYLAWHRTRHGYQ